MQQRNANKDRPGKKGSLKKSLAHSGHYSVNVSSRQGRERECKNEKNLENLLTHWLWKTGKNCFKYYSNVRFQTTVLIVQAVIERI